MAIVLGIHDGHDASAAVSVDGRIVAAAQEERFTGRRNECGYPHQSVAACLKASGVAVDSLDEVAVASHDFDPVRARVKREANFRIADYITEHHRYWRPRLLGNERVSYWDIFRDREDFDYDRNYPTESFLHEDLTIADQARAREVRRVAIAGLAGVALSRTRTLSHEHCHVAYAYCASHLGRRALALTAESFGDETNGTVSVVSETAIDMLAKTNENNLGRIYRNITLLLGMTPFQHEYKVMGLAPYANERERVRSLKVLDGLLKVDGLNVVFDRHPRDLYFHFRDAFEGHRFDGIAGAIQQFLEETLCTWLRACIATTGVGRIVFSGGVAQNIKACQAMAALDEVTDFSVSPASGDTSLSIGACYLAERDRAQQAGELPTTHPLNNIYLGPEFDDADIRAVLRDTNVTDRYEVSENASPDLIARRLARGDIIARCCGRMEFGARALGNRSILADPRNPATVGRINNAIKFRDFWMPFTPAVLSDRAEDYFVNPKKLRSPYMTMAFHSTPLARAELPAALHPADFTMRPQVLDRSMNPAFFDLIKAFERLTGVGALLNTSFNLHGKPIVLGPREALHTLDNSALDGVIIGEVLISRRREG